MKKTILLSNALFCALLCAGLAAAEPASAAFTRSRQVLTVAFGQRNIQIEVPKGMCFLDKTNPKQAAFLNEMRQNSWKSRKNVVMTLFADCRELANLEGSKEPVPLTSVGILRWLNPDIGTQTEMIPNDYLDMREVSFRAHTANSLTQFHDVKIEEQPKRLKNAVAIGYVGNTMVDGERYATVGVDATMLLQDIPVDVTFMKTTAGFDHVSEDTAPLFTLTETFIDQQVTLNSR